MSAWLVAAARRPWLTLAIAAPIAAAGGLLFVLSGVMPLKASAGHWAITEWLLHFTMRRSVWTYARFVTVPPLDDPALVLRGAAHYDLGCRPCHGTPRGDRPAVALAMLPPPPELKPRVPVWSDAELFYIVKHGVKFTGMPAWPTQQRDDEVWAVVAFLRRLPAMNEEEYLALAQGEPETTLAFESGTEPPGVIRESCARCHGFDGGGRGDAFPRLDGQRVEYMARAMRAYADRQRQSGVMSSVVAGFTPEVMRLAAEFYAALPPAEPLETAGRDPGGDSARGERIALEGIPERDVPACAECHGPSSLDKHAAYPRLAGQHADYLRRQLDLLQQRRRGGSEFVHLMEAFVDRLTAADILDVTAFFASLAPDAPSERSGR